MNKRELRQIISDQNKLFDTLDGKSKRVVDIYRSKTLNDAERVIFALYYHFGTYVDIARALGVSKTTSKKSVEGIIWKIQKRYKIKYGNDCFDI